MKASESAVSPRLATREKDPSFTEEVKTEGVGGSNAPMLLSSIGSMVGVFQRGVRGRGGETATREESKIRAGGWNKSWAHLTVPAVRASTRAFRHGLTKCLWSSW